MVRMDRHRIEDPVEDTDYWLDTTDGVNFDVNRPPEEQARKPSPVATSSEVG